MAKRISRSRLSTNKSPTPSPNPRNKKQTKTDSSDATTASNVPEIVENQTNDLHFLDQFIAPIAEAVPGVVSGGRPLWAHLVSPPKPTWHKIDQLLKTTETAYNMLDKFQEGDSLHDRASTGKNLRGVTGNGKVLTAEGWRILFKELYETTTDLATSPKGATLRVFGLRLALTAPKVIFEGAEWVVKAGETIGLQSGLVTDAWTGAYLYFGAPWKQVESFKEYLEPPGKPSARPSLKDHSLFDPGKALKVSQAPHNRNPDEYILSSDDEEMVEPPDSSGVEAASASLKVATLNNSVKKKHIGFARQLYIQKEKVKINPQTHQKKKKWNETRKISSFLKIRTPKLKTINRLDQETEFLEVMQEICAKLWTIDASLVVFPWKKCLEDSKPIQKGKAFPGNRDAFADFTERIFLKRGENVWIRLHVGHNKPITTALKEDRFVDHFRQKDMLVYKDTLQVKTTAKAGWLLGSHTSVLNARDLEDALALLPEMEGLPVEIRTEWVSIDKGDKLKLKAAHILCSWDSTLLCRRALNLSLIHI